MATDRVVEAIEQTEQLLGQLDQLLKQREQSGGRKPKQQPESRAVNEVATPEVNKSRAKNRAANQAALQLLMDTYPKAFSRTQVRPLKIGIQEDLIADDKVAKNKIKRALASYVRSYAYYRSLQSGAARIDLNGEAAGQVSEQEAEYARGRLKELSRQRREREQLKRAQQREQEKAQRLNEKLEQLVKLKGS